MFNETLRCGHVINASEENAGGWPVTDMRNFLNTRVLRALPIDCRSALRLVTIKSSAGSGSSEIVYSQDYLFAPSYTEMGGTTSIPYTEEGAHFGWYNSNEFRVKYRGILVPDYKHVYTTSSDPSGTSSNNVQAGDLWRNNSYGIYYMYIPKEIHNKHNYNNADGYYEYTVAAADGNGLWIASATYATRSPDIQFNTNYHIISQYGYISS